MKSYMAFCALLGLAAALPTPHHQQDLSTEADADNAHNEVAVEMSALEKRQVSVNVGGIGVGVGVSLGRPYYGGYYGSWGGYGYPYGRWY